MSSTIARQLITDEALRRGWTVERFGEDNEFYFVTHSDGRRNMFRGSRPIQSTANGCIIAANKSKTMAFLESLGYTLPEYLIPDSLEEAVAFMFGQRSVAVKPVDGAQGKGVAVNIRDVNQLDKAMTRARAYSRTSTVLLQRYLKGNSYRLMVLAGQFIAGLQRRAAEVTGDGTQTVKALIEQMNKDPRRGISDDSVLRKVSLSQAVELLGRDGINAIPKKGETVRVNAIDNVSSGGDAINMTAQVHPSWCQAVAGIAQKAGLFICAFDVVCDDISQPLPTPAPILEMNSMPGLRMAHFPTAGESVDVAGMLLDAVFAAKK